MLLADSLIVIGLATASLGTIHEADGPVDHTFCLRNAGSDTVAVRQAYASCGCTTLHFDRARRLAPADTMNVVLRFNPRGKGGDFEETGTLVYGSLAGHDAAGPGTAAPRQVRLVLTGHCISSEETLLRQFPVRISDAIRRSANRFDLGYMRTGERRERTVVVLHRGGSGPQPAAGTTGADRQERIAVTFTATRELGSGLHHVSVPITIAHGADSVSVPITFDVIIK